jgi:hypothetical protein
VSTRKAKPTYLSIFLCTPPGKTTVPKGVIAGWDKEHHRPLARCPIRHRRGGSAESGHGALAA